jgi:hypothetical protein
MSSFGIHLPEDLIRELARGNCVAFVGAGLSVAAGYPDWPGFLRKLIDKTADAGLLSLSRAELEQAITQGDLPDVAEELRASLGAPRFRAAITEILRSIRPQFTPLHDALISLPFRSIITTNYDTLIESAYGKRYGQPPPLFTHADYPELSAALRTGRIYVLKAHGTLDRSATIILSRADYREIMHGNPAYKKHLESVVLNHTVLFLGFSVTDPDLLLFLEQLSIAFTIPVGNLYAVLNEQSTNAIRRKRLERDFSIKVLSYKPSRPDHPEVLSFLQDLRHEASLVPEGQIDVMTGGHTPLQAFAADVQSWLEAMRYVVDRPIRLNDRVMAMTAVLHEGLVRQHIRIHCVGAEASARDVLTLERSLDLDCPEGWIIADRRISPEAAEALSRAVRLFTFADFLEKVVWGNYVSELRSEAARIRLDDLYVDPMAFRIPLDEDGRAVPPFHRTDLWNEWRIRLGHLEDYIDRWLPERGKSHISVLGDFGSGKTWFARHYTMRQLDRFLRNPAHERLPILITLRTFAKAMTVEQLLNDVFYEQFKLPFLGSAYDVFRQMNRRGKVLLILDGFDEMARQVDYQTVVDNFWELARLVEDDSKVILTSRTEYFRWAQESEKILGGQEYGRSRIVLEPPRFEVIYIEPFTDAQIREVIVRRLGKETGQRTATALLRLRNISEMLRKPVLIELFLAAIDEVAAESLDSPATVYLHATNRLMLRNIRTQKTFTLTRDKLYFLCELAWEMLSNQSLRIHFTQIPNRIQAYFGDRIADSHELDNWDFDLRTQTLLHRDAAGYYEFAHKSLAEYFVALKFCCELGCLPPEFASTYEEESGRPSELPYSPKGVTELAPSFGKFLIGADERMFAVRDLLLSMIRTHGTLQLWNLLDRTRGVASSYVASNCATLLALMGASFVGRDLQGLVLDSAILPRDMRDVNISGSSLLHVNLIGYDLRGANMSGATFSPGKLAGSDIRDVHGKIAVSWISDAPEEPQKWSDDIVLQLTGFIRGTDAVCCLVGPRGSGKSSALAQLLRTLQDDSERVAVTGSTAWSWTMGEFTRMMRSPHLNMPQVVLTATYLSSHGYNELASAVEPLRQSFLSSGAWSSAPDDTHDSLLQHIRRAIETERFVFFFDDFSPNRMQTVANVFLAFRHRSKILISSTDLPEDLKGRVTVVRTESLTENLSSSPTGTSTV